jgi:hypothetical protein
MCETDEKFTGPNRYITLIFRTATGSTNELVDNMITTFTSQG